MTTLPTLLLIPGAFAPPTTYDNFVPSLTTIGFEDVVVATHPSYSPEDPFAVSAATDIQHCRKTHLLPLIEERGKDVAIFAHSYGGLVTGGLASGLSKTDRVAAGLKGGVVGLLYHAGLILTEGMTFLELVGGMPEVLEEDVPVPGMLTMKSTGRTHAKSIFTTPAPKPAWAEAGYNGRRAYIRTMQDKSVSPDLQNALLRGGMERGGVEWDVEEIQAAHDSFLDKPDELAVLVERIVKGWVAS